jgi:undecaprenyl-diphosphatase
MNRSRIPLIAGVSAAAFALLALAVTGHGGPLLGFDAWASRTAHAAALAHPLWRATMAAITVTGSTAIIGPVAAAGCLVLLGFGRWRQAAFAAVALTATLGIRLIVVAAIARPRPTGQLTTAQNFSFPSGHSTASAAAALILVVVCWPMLTRRWSRVLLGVAAGAWAFTVGLSRVALVVHWPTDVLGAWLFVLALVPPLAVVAMPRPTGARSASPASAPGTP